MITKSNYKIEETSLNNTDALETFEPSSQQQAELEKYYKDISDKFQTGKVIIGVIIAKQSSSVLVDIDYKSNGAIPNYEFSDYELKKLAVNDTIEVLLDRLEDENGFVVLSYQKAKSIKAWDKISQLAAEDEPARGIVTHKVKGGLSVDIGIPAFLPGSQVDIQRVTNFDQFVGQEVICKILKVNRKRGNVIVSRRKHLEEQRHEDKKKALELINEDQILQGSVKNITNYGAFVDIGGVDGLLHITDMSWGRIAHPSEMLKIGDKINVKVISLDKKNEKVSLGMKQLTKNPWETVASKYPIGSKIKGRVSSITDYGLFVEVEKGIEGLVHISEVSWTERITNLSHHFKVNEAIEVTVVSIDKENRRMSLSIKQLQDDPWQTVTEKFKVGEKIKGKITNITDFGLFVQLLDGVDGLVHVSDLSWTEHVTHPSDNYKKGNEIEAAVLEIDAENKKISLGIKQMNKDPWEIIEQEYPVGKIVQGTVCKITNFGAFVKMASGIEGLVHISELTDKEVNKAEEIVQVGQVDEFKIIKVNREERKIGLSLKAAKKKTHNTTQGKTDSHKKRSESPHKESRTTLPPQAPDIKNPLQQALQEFKDQQKKDDEKKKKETL